MTKTQKETGVPQTSSEMDGKYLSFLLDGQFYAVSIADVLQIVVIQPITEMPDFPSFAKGIINLRGSVIPVIDARMRFGKPEKPYQDNTCIIILNIQEQLIGLIVDGVDEVSTIHEEDISPPPQLAGAVADFITGICTHGKKIILMLNAEKTLC